MNYRCVEIPEPDFDASFTDEMVVTAYQDEDDFNPQMLDEYPNVRLTQLEANIQQTSLTAAEAFETANNAEELANQASQAATTATESANAAGSLASQAAQAAQEAAGIAEGAATTAGEAAQSINTHATATTNPHPTNITQEFADTQITQLAVEATYTPTVWSYLVGLFTTVPKSVKEHLVKIWTIINAIAFVEPITEVETFTLALTHLYKGIRCNSATAMDCNIPLNDTVAFPVGSVISIQQIGNGVVTAKAVSGVTLNGDAKTAGQYKFIQLWKTDTNVWNVIGGVA